MARVIAVILLLMFFASCNNAPQPAPLKSVQLTPAMAYQMLTEKPPGRRIAADFQAAIAQGDTRFLSVDNQTPIASTQPGLVEKFGTKPGLNFAQAIIKYGAMSEAERNADGGLNDPPGTQLDAALYNMGMLHYLEINHQIPLTQPTTR